MKYFEMFAGIGGFRYGIEKVMSQAECIGFSEIDKYAIQIYKKHYLETKNYEDATRIISEELPDFNFLVGGFPCQSFSIAGKRGGFEDTRGTLFFEIARIARVKRPELLLLENVKGLLSHDKGRTFGTILSTLSGMGYFLEWQVLNSKDFKTPHSRPRVFIIGYLNREYTRQVFPIVEENQRTLKLTHCITGKTPSGLSRMNDRMYSITGTSPCLTSSFNSEVVNMTELKRNLTPVECERLQGFPDGWTEYGMEKYHYKVSKSYSEESLREVKISDTQRYKCLGNAVTTTVITEIIKRLFNQNQKGGGI